MNRTRVAHAAAPGPVDAVVHGHGRRVLERVDRDADPGTARVEPRRDELAHEQRARVGRVGERVGEPAGVVADAGREAPARADDHDPGAPGVLGVDRARPSRSAEDSSVGRPGRRGLGMVTAGRMRPVLMPLSANGSGRGAARASTVSSITARRAVARACPRSARIVRSTRKPSRIALRLLSPKIRLFSMLPTSTMRCAAEEEAAVQHGLDLEPVAPDHRVRRLDGVVGQVQTRHEPAPEGVVAVAEVRVPAAEQHVRDPVEEVVAERAEAGDVLAAAAVREARPLRDVGALGERPDERRDLVRVGRAVGVEHDDDVAGRRGEAARQCVALALAGLLHDVDAGHHASGGLDRVVDRVPVDEDDLVHGRQLRQHDLEVSGLVACGDDDGDGGGCGGHKCPSDVTHGGCAGGMARTRCRSNDSLRGDVGETVREFAVDKSRQ